MKKIMFNDKYGLTQAVLEGRKTQTRRIITHPKTFHGKDVCGFYVCRRVTDNAVTEVCMYDEDEISIDEGQILPKYMPGEVVAVAQSYKDLGYNPISLDISPKDYMVSRGTLGKSKGWNNKMFVRADACKHQIRITNVRVERLQDISNKDCFAEGISILQASRTRNYGFYERLKENFNAEKTPRAAYASLIDKISGKGTWDKNPFVFVYDFELLK